VYGKGTQMMNYCRKQNVIMRSVAGTHLLVPVNGCTRSVYTLNATGCQLWELIEQPHTKDKLAEALAGQYAIPLKTALQDVQSFLAEMEKMGLLEKKK